jgi:polyphosphate kinase 2
MDEKHDVEQDGVERARAHHDSIVYSIEDELGTDVKEADHTLKEDPEQPTKRYKKNGKLKKKFYEKELRRLQTELVKLQYWVKQKGLRVVIIFEGRGSAGKGGVIKRITERTSSRIVRVAALPVPTERERTQWYFQRYVAHLPAAGEIVLFDRSWYNRSNVEWVMGFANERQVQEFLRSAPQFERMLVRSGIIVLKYWFSVSYEEQRKRFASRNQEPLKRWKLSDMDLAEHRLFTKYSQAKDMTFEYTDMKQAPWYVVPSDDKDKARLNTIHHILSMIPYEDVVPAPIDMPEREEFPYIRPPMEEQTFVPQEY